MRGGGEHLCGAEPNKAAPERRRKLGEACGLPPRPLAWPLLAKNGYGLAAGPSIRVRTGLAAIGAGAAPA